MKNTKDALQFAVIDVLRSNFFHTTARSRHTATNSTDGKAPCKKLARKAARQTKAAAGQQDLRPHRYRPGTVALPEIHKYQKSMELVIRKAPFQGTVREIAEARIREVRFEGGALKALQHTTEAFSVELFHEAQGCLIRTQRVTFYPKNIYIAASVICGGYFVLRDYTVDVNRIYFAEN